MNKKIAIPVDNDNVLDSHFGHCKYFVLFGIEDNKFTNEEKLVPPPHEPGLLPRWLADKGVTDIIAGGMGEKAIQLFNQFNVNVFVGAPQLPSKELAEGYLNNTLRLTANYCDHDHNHECSGH